MDIIKFLNGKKVKMGTITFTVNDWQTVCSYYPNKAFVEEKILGMLYFTVIRSMTSRRSKIDIVTCTETGINIRKVHQTCQRISKWNHMDFRFSDSTEDLNPIIKVADFIASSSRKLKSKELRKYPNFFIENRKSIPQWVYRRVFR